MIYLLTAIGLSPGGSSTVHIYAQTIHVKQSHYRPGHVVFKGLNPDLDKSNVQSALPPPAHPPKKE